MFLEATVLFGFFCFCGGCAGMILQVFCAALINLSLKTENENARLAAFESDLNSLLPRADFASPISFNQLQFSESLALLLEVLELFQLTKIKARLDELLSSPAQGGQT
jgi:hypothetical protein